MQICRPNSLEVTEVIAAQPSEYIPKLRHKTGLKSESPVTIRKLCIVINNCGKPAAFQFTCFALPNMAAKSIRFSGLCSVYVYIWHTVADIEVSMLTAGLLLPTHSLPR